MNQVADGEIVHFDNVGLRYGTDREVLDEDYPDTPFLWLDTANAHAEVFSITAEALASRSGSEPTEA